MAAGRDVESFFGGLSSPETIQERCLFERVLRPNELCEYGRKHSFSSIKTVADYRRAVPVVGFGELSGDIERIANGESGVLFSEPARRFFLTSGSSSRAKTIPVTSSFIGDKARAFGLYWSMLFDQHPRAASGKVVGNFSDSGGSQKLPGGLWASSEGSYWSAVGAATQQRGKSPLPRLVGTIIDANARYYVAARILAEENVSLMMALNPSTVLLLCRKMNEFRETLLRDVERGGLSSQLDVPDEVRQYVASRYPGNPSRASELRRLLQSEEPALRARSVWPSLELVVSWRSPMQTHYLSLLEPHLGDVAQRDYILMASEGIIAIPHEDGRSGGLLATPIHFYEFIPEEQLDRAAPDVLSAHELEIGRTYAVLLSTTAGLYRYSIGDILRVTGIKERTPIVEFLYRAGATSSLTGEKLTEEQVVSAVAAVARTTALTRDRDGAQAGAGAGPTFTFTIEGFTLVPAKSGFPRYVLLAELGGPRLEKKQLADLPGAIDAELERHNIEYAAKRRSLRLEAPEVWLVAPGSYERLRRRRVAEGANDAQIKPVGLARDPHFADQFDILEQLHAD
jgi:hypothetical protein